MKNSTLRGTCKICGGKTLKPEHKLCYTHYNNVNEKCRECGTVKDLRFAREESKRKKERIFYCERCFKKKVVTKESSKIEKIFDYLGEDDYVPYKNIRIKKSRWETSLLIPFWISILLGIFFPSMIWLYFIIFFVMLIGSFFSKFKD